ncbi:cysteine peptidase family C39 domain-containing protein [Cyclobacterium sp. SYSU L10401]|uniref:cysteine peptidase family C39 domain-containing protein n=1 Tax=Cyclobacterium sp. SYSU L10401 TaxID=2678657 RepID=UPI0013D6944B|nr:cysteine peptidase family C39 domain-containing protein [Cyclobacterium sp. SYSU L10401]
MNNCFHSSGKILELLKIRFTKNYLKEEILSHPQFPSLLTLSDVLEKYHISTLPLKVGKEKLDQIPMPCIVQVKVQGKEYFQTLSHIAEDSFSGYDEEGKKFKLSREDFLHSWTGVVLAVEKSEHAAEPRIEERLQKEKIQTFLMAGLVLFALIAVGFGWPELMGSGYGIATAGLLLLKLIGLGVSGLILWREIDKDNPLVQKFCSGGAKTDCNTVLDSAAFKFADAAISPGSLAFAYFFSGSLLLLTQISPLRVLPTLAWLSLATLPVVVISFYYQAFRIKSWCRLCLFLIGILVLEMALVWAQQVYQHAIDLPAVAAFAFLFIASLLGWIYLKPILDAKDKHYTYQRNLKKLKSDPVIFDSLLTRSKKINNPTGDLGILLKNESPRYQVIKVCNPYCGPCSEAHPELERLVEEGIIDLQIIFFPNNSTDDLHAKTISHLLAINSKGDPKVTQEALDIWYAAEKKDYTVFAERYPMNGELSKQQEKLLAMKSWCEKEGIIHTPTIFINGYQLPKEYSIADIKEINVYK